MIRPMRGVAPDTLPLRFPYLAFPKIDGLRALVKDGVVYSKRMKPLPNPEIQRLFSHLHGVDAELTVGPATAQHPDDSVFARTTGMARRVQPVAADFRLHIFDVWDNQWLPMMRRYHSLLDRFREQMTPQMSIVPAEYVDEQWRLDAMLERALGEGYEGLILRDPKSLYKYGQATEKQGWFLKLKPFEHGEGEVIGLVQATTNTNEAELSEDGYTKRSTSKAGRQAKDTLGALVLRDLETGQEFNAGFGKGFTADKVEALWRLGDRLLGKIARYQYQKIGTQVRPRLPKIDGFREPFDLA